MSNLEGIVGRAFRLVAQISAEGVNWIVISLVGGLFLLV